MSQLTSYWISLLIDGRLHKPPQGFGVTAYSLEDALALLEAAGYDSHKSATEVYAMEGAVPSKIDAKHVAPNSGPHTLRGVWFPCHNIGFGAPTRGS